MQKGVFSGLPRLSMQWYNDKIAKVSWLILKIKILETLPVVMRPPVLTSITEHSLTVLVDMTYDQSARKPEYYQIQYKNV
jgi:hypothetical protein